MLSTTTIYDADKHLPTNEFEDSKISLVLEDLMEKENFSIRESIINNDKGENLLEYSRIRQKKLSIFDSEKQSAEDGERKIPNDERTLGLLSSHGKDTTNSDGLEIKHKILEKKGPKQVKAKTCSGLEKELYSQSNTKVVGKKSVDLPSLEGSRELESDTKVHKSLDTFICQTMGCKTYMSFSSRPSDKPLQRMIEHQQAMEKCVQSLKVDIDIRDGLVNNTNVEPHQKNDPSGTKGRGSHVEKNLQTIKSNVPQTVAVLAAATIKNPNLPGRPLLSPSKVQLLKCEKCSREFFSLLNHRRHTRTHHRRINYVDKLEDLILKRKNVAAFWDKLNHDETQQIFIDSRKYDLEDLSGEVVVNNLIAFKGQNNQMTFPPTYIKAGQDLLDMLDNKQRIFSLSSEQILSILDEASEKTFLYSQGDVTKIGLEEKNLVASLGYIVEQTLVKAWMVDKDAEALRNQQELFKEEEAAQMKRVRNVAKKKKKKEKSRQKGLKERKIGVIQSSLNEENESVDGENPSLEIVEEDNSPTTSSTSLNSTGLENQLLEPLEMEVNTLIQNVNRRDHDHSGEDGSLQKPKDILSVHLTSKEVVPDSFDEDQMQQSGYDLVSNGEEEERYSKSLSFNQRKVEDQGGCDRILEQDQSIVESRKRTSWRPYKEPMRFDYQDSYQRGSWVPDPRFQEGIQQNSYRTLRKSSIGTLNMSNIESGSNIISGFYRGKPTNLRGVVPFPATQQWAKKVQTLVSLDHIKDGQEDGSSQEHDTSKSIIKDSIVEHAILGRETDADTIDNISRTKKEYELKIFEKKELSLIAVPSVAKVVASTRGLSSMPSSSFNLNVNSEDWPPLSISHATYYPKSVGRYPLTSYQCELNSRPVNKINIDRGGDYLTRLESKVDGSILSIIPSARSPIDYTASGSTTISRQKGIMIGSVSVPLGDYMHISRSELESVSKRINTPVWTNQSYTSVLAAPPVRYTRDPMTNTTGRQKARERTNSSEFEESPNIQVIDSYGGIGGPYQYRTLSLKSTSSINFNVRHMRGPTFERTHTYLLGDQGERGIFSKQPSWSSRPIRHMPQKVWRPIQSTAENADPNADGGSGIEDSRINNNEKELIQPPSSEGSVNALSSRSKGIQVWNTDISRGEECLIFSIDTKAQFIDGNGVLDLKSMKENVPQNVTHLHKSIVSNPQHLQCKKETSRVALVTSKDDSEKPYQSIKYNVTEENTKCIFQKKNDNTKFIDEKAHMKTALSHLDWIAEVKEFHLNRWHSALKDPETIVSKCVEEHSELQTSVWIDFINNLPSIVTRLILRKEDSHDPTMKASNCNDKIGTKNFKNLPNEQTSTNTQNNRHEGSRVGLEAIPTSEEFRDASSLYESGSPSGVGSTTRVPTSGLQNYGKNDNEKQIESRCGNSCSDSSMSSNSQTKRRDQIGTLSTTCDRP